jgi:hypothetical protein
LVLYGNSLKVLALQFAAEVSIPINFVDKKT